MTQLILMKLCNVQGERRGTVRRVGSDKLASLTLQELAKCKSTKCNDKCTKVIENISSNYKVYVQKIKMKKSQKIKLITNKAS